MITRNLYTELSELLEDFPAVALLGPRQVGKTTLAMQVKDQFPNSLYLDLEDQDDLNKLQDIKLFLNQYQDTLVIIDEVQVKPELFTALRPIIDRNRKTGRFLLLGSASPLLVKGVSESLAGRIAYTELTPFLLKEVLADGITQQQLWWRGGFADSLLAKSDRQAQAWTKSFISSYVQKELPQLFNVDLSPLLSRNFWQMLSHYHGSIWNAQPFSASLGVANTTVRRYLEYLQGAFLIRILQPWYVNTGKRLIKSPKVYVRDSGLLHSMLGIKTFESLFGYPLAGASWEGFVIEQIAGILPDGIDAFYYRTQNGAEADLILVKGLTPIAAIEIKLTNAPVPSRGFYQSIEDLGLKTGIVITPGSDNYPQKNLTICSLQYFIEDLFPEITA